MKDPNTNPTQQPALVRSNPRPNGSGKRWVRTAAVTATAFIVWWAPGVAAADCPAGYGMCAAGWCCPACNDNPMSEGCTTNGVCSGGGGSSSGSGGGVCTDPSAPVNCGTGCCPQVNGSSNVCCPNNTCSTDGVSCGSSSGSASGSSGSLQTSNDGCVQTCEHSGSGSCDLQACADSCGNCSYSLNGAQICGFSCANAASDPCVNEAAQKLQSCQSGGCETDAQGGLGSAISALVVGAVLMVASRRRRRAAT
jgi:hypothetical protein